MVKMRRFMVQTKKLEVMKYKELDPIILANLWTLCQISLTKLSCPIGKGYIWKLISLTGLTKVNITNYIVTCDLLTVFSVNIKKTTFIRSLFSTVTAIE